MVLFLKASMFVVVLGFYTESLTAHKTDPVLDDLQTLFTKCTERTNDRKSCRIGWAKLAENCGAPTSLSQSCTQDFVKDLPRYWSFLTRQGITTTPSKNPEKVTPTPSKNPKKY